MFDPDVQKCFERFRRLRRRMVPSWRTTKSRQSTIRRRKNSNSGDRPFFGVRFNVCERESREKPNHRSKFIARGDLGNPQNSKKKKFLCFRFWSLLLMSSKSVFVVERNCREKMIHPLFSFCFYATIFFPTDSAIFPAPNLSGFCVMLRNFSSFSLFSRFCDKRKA